MKTTISQIVEKALLGKIIKIRRYNFKLNPKAQSDYRYFISARQVPKDTRFSFDKEVDVEIIKIYSDSDSHEGDNFSFEIVDKENEKKWLLSITILDKITIIK